MTASTRISFIAGPLICALIPLVGIPYIQWRALTPQGTDRILWTAIIFALPALAALPGFLVGLVGLAFPSLRRYAAFLALCSAAYFIAFVISRDIGQSVRIKAFHQLAERSRPLIAAIRAFEEKHGHPPETLESLVPEFLPAVPSTGMGAYPEYRYSPSLTNYHGNPWVITIFTPAGGINFDQFMYFPLTNYPSTGYGGRLERIGDWAYVHE